MTAIARKHAIAAAARPAMNSSQTCAFILCGFFLAAAAAVTSLPAVSPVAAVSAEQAYRTDIGLQPQPEEVNLAAYVAE